MKQKNTFGLKMVVHVEVIDAQKDRKISEN